MELLVWGVIGRYWRELEEFIIQSSLQVETEPQKTIGNYPRADPPFGMMPPCCGLCA